MEGVILTIHVVIAVAMIGLVLLQQGKGAEMGASFGAGASQTVFGAAGTAGFLVKLIGSLAIAFFVTSMLLAWYAHKHAQEAGVLKIPGIDQTVPSAPATSAPAGDVPAAPPITVTPAAPQQKAPASPDVPVAPNK